MEILQIKTRPLLPPKDDLDEVILSYVTSLKERDVVIVSSKVVAIGEGNCLPMYDIEKDNLIEREAEYYIPRNEHPNGVVITTVIKHTLIASAGIDESNGNGYYILWPKNPMQSAKRICDLLKKHYQVKDLAVIITDSHCLPMRAGVTGIGIGFSGFDPCYSYKDKPDIFGRLFHYSQTNIVDSLAAMGNFFMGEGPEQTPIVIIRNLETHYLHLNFCDQSNQTFWFKREDDMFYPFFKNMKKGGAA